MSGQQGKPYVEQAKEAVAAAGQKVGETWEATKATVADVSKMMHASLCWRPRLPLQKAIEV
jgi:hypothetical protein